MNGPAGIEHADITLGLIAGGRATRLGGIDKAWLRRDGVAQVVRLRRRFGPQAAQVLVSANRDPARYVAEGMIVIGDRVEGLGPIGGLDALAHACGTSWLFTLPVDVVDLNDCVLRTLASRAAGDGAWAGDDDGVQPLVALWRVDALRAACEDAIAIGRRSVQGLQATMDMAAVCFGGVRFGNLNTPDDLAAAGIDAD